MLIYLIGKFKLHRGGLNHQYLIFINFFNSQILPEIYFFEALKPLDKCTTILPHRQHLPLDLSQTIHVGIYLQQLLFSNRTNMYLIAKYLERGKRSTQAVLILPFYGFHYQ